jgi:DNA-binding MarR family transcriptional regulator
MTTDRSDDAPRRLSLLYQLYLTNQSARRFMRAALADAPLTGEEFALFSYLYANGPRTLSQAARELGTPVTSLATTLGPLIDSERVTRRRHPRDRRARLLALTDTGRADLMATIPAFSEGYQLLLARLEDAGADIERAFQLLEALRTAMNAVSDDLELVDPDDIAAEPGS